MALKNPPQALPLRRIQWSLEQPAQVNRSAWTSRRQVFGLPGAAKWRCSGELVPIIGQGAARKWRGFFNSLEGPVHKFPVIAVESAQHAGAETTIASGAAGAVSLELAAAPPALQAGDFLSVKLSDGSWQLVQLTADVAGTSAAFVPPLRLAAATGAGSVETILPFAHVSLSEDAYEYTVDPGAIYTFAFTAEESF